MPSLLAFIFLFPNRRLWCMRNSTTFPNKLIFGLSLKICIITGLCCYVVLLGIIELTHDHTEHEHCHSENTYEDTCTACFYNNLHVGVEIESFAYVSPFLFRTTLPLHENVFLPLRFTANTRCRAPPVFSNNLTNFAS